MDIARDICTDSFYIVNSGLPCIAVTAVKPDLFPHIFVHCRVCLHLIEREVLHQIFHLKIVKWFCHQQKQK